MVHAGVAISDDNSAPYVSWPAVDHRLAAWARVLQRQLEAVPTHDGRDDAEAQARARHIAVALAAIEALQHQGALVLLDAGTVVLHHDPGVVRLVAQADLDRAAGAAELDGVVD